MDIQEHISIAPHTTMRVGGTVQYFVPIAHETQLPEINAFAREKNVPMHILGDGSNTIFGDGDLSLCVIHMENQYIRVWSVEQDRVYVESGAGTEWDALVTWTIQRGYSGIECLSGIPGTVGAAPIQNIGAYGQELKDSLIQVRVYDTQRNIFVSIPAKWCKLAYRNSIFKEQSYKEKYIITSLVCCLSLTPPSVPTYTDLQNYFHAQQTPPSLAQIREAILSIRSQKLPDWTQIPNEGSFFKNPIISSSDADSLRQKYPDIKLFPINDTQVKIAAGWLIEQCGFKGSYIGPVGVYEKNALVLTNPNMASCADILHAQDTIIQSVQKKFGITLETEPDIIK